jgi:hypothetical protein
VKNSANQGFKKEHELARKNIFEENSSRDPEKTLSSENLLYVMVVLYCQVDTVLKQF